MTCWTRWLFAMGAVLCPVRWLAASLDSTQSPDMLQVSRGRERGGHPSVKKHHWRQREQRGERQAVGAIKTQSQIIRQTGLQSVNQIFLWVFLYEIAKTRNIFITLILNSWKPYLWVSQSCLFYKLNKNNLFILEEPGLKSQQAFTKPSFLTYCN